MGDDDDDDDDDDLDITGNDFSQNQELERLDIQKDEPIASQNLNLENAPVELEDVRRGYVSVMEPNIEVGVEN